MSEKSEKTVFIYREPSESSQKVEDPRFLAQRLVNQASTLIKTYTTGQEEDKRLKISLGIVLGLAYFVERWQRLVGFGKRDHRSWQKAFLKGLCEELSQLWPKGPGLNEYLATYLETNYNLLARELDAFPLPLGERQQALVHLGRLIFEGQGLEEDFATRASEVLKGFFNPP